MIRIIILSAVLALVVVFTVAKAIAIALRIRRRLAAISAQVYQLEQELRCASLQLIQMRGREIQDDSTGRRLEVRCLSQYGEEPILWALLGYKSKGYYIEVGAYDGVRLSVSYFFESIGWSGLLVEANPELYEECRKARPGSKVVNAAVGGRGASGTIEFSKVVGADGVDALGFVQASDEHVSKIRQEKGRIETTKVAYTSLAQLLDQERPESLDLAVIDVEGIEAVAIEGLELERWTPRVVMVEHNTKGAKDNYPAAQILQKHGYRFCTRCKGNDIFISRDVR